MKKLLSWLDEYFEESILLTLFAFLVGTVLVEVFRRYVLHNSGQYSEEIARYTLIIIIYLGIPYGIKKRCHICCNVLPSSIPPKLNFTVTFIANLLFLLMCVIMSISGYAVVQQQIMVNKITPAMYVPMWYFSSVVGIGFFLGIFRLIQVMWQDIKNYPYPIQGTSEHEEIDLAGSL